MASNDRKIFAPMLRGQPRSPASQVWDVLSRCEVGATAARLADELVRLGLAVGVKTSVTERIAELLGDLERAARVERIPDGRYRVVRTRPMTAGDRGR